jgi:hypothetical protein
MSLWCESHENPGDRNLTIDHLLLNIDNSSFARCSCLLQQRQVFLNLC